MLEVLLGVFQQNNHHRVTTFVDEHDILDIYMDGFNSIPQYSNHDDNTTSNESDYISK